jgi:hypothetical protein
MRMGWLMGWAVPQAWFGSLVRGAFPSDDHVLIAPGPGALSEMEGRGPFDWVAGYSLGSLLLLRESGRVAALGRVALLAPIFGFPLEAGLGGRVRRAQLKLLSRRLAADPVGPVLDFHRRAGLDVPEAEARGLAGAALAWGLEQLESGELPARLPPGWLAWCGAGDVLLDAGRLHALAPGVRVVPGATHHPAGLLAAFAREAAP